MIPQPRPVHPELRAQAQDPAVLAAANINPITRLATDYLNHYNEVVMLLEMLESCPEFVPDIVGWEPRAYDEYFVRSHFKDRDLALVAWEYADPAARMELERLADHMNAILAATLDALRLELSPRACGQLGCEASNWLKPLVARAGSVINGEHVMSVVTGDAARQAMIDAVFEQGA
ncbi:hypothetical protein [Rhodoplanes serenus]|uniref:hypothetical protein n=1 Tax=Rhodoplanes serenus TaxID=200615 RepID=UPI001AECB68A|nr:hypothetical protein [Rhodoplanes serenus]